MASYSFLDLNDAETVRNFAYKGKHGMAEDEVKAAVKSTLEGRGYEVRVKWGKKSGSDILATVVGNKLVIEAKGEGATRQALGNNFLYGLGEILMRMSENGTSYGVALRAHPSYVELVSNFPNEFEPPCS